MLDNNLTPEEKKKEIASHFSEIMKILGLDMDNDSLKDTPQRVAKMYVDELFSGLEDDLFPKVMKVPNDETIAYKGLVLEKDIPFYSMCEHHFVPIVGVAHIAYIPGVEIIGLSKLNRIVEYFSKKPQVQERFTQEIHSKLQEILQTKDIAVIIESEHMCVSMRGIKHRGATTITSQVTGNIQKEELFQMIFKKDS